MIEVAIPCDFVQLETHSNQWHKWRAQGLGGSDVAAAVGLSSYASPMSVWLRKTGRIAPDPETPVMRMGTILEPFVRDLFAREVSGELFGEQLCCSRKDEPWMLATLDNLIKQGDEISTVEYKTTNNSDYLVEPYYGHVVQCLWGLAVTGFKRCYLAVLDRANGNFVVHVIERDDEAIELLIEQGREFMAHVENNTQPPHEIGPQAKTAQALARTMPTYTSTELSDTAVGHVRIYLDLRKDRAAISEEIEAHKVAIQAALLEHEIGLYNGVPLVTFKPTRNGSRRLWIIEPKEEK